MMRWRAFLLLTVAVGTSLVLLGAQTVEEQREAFLKSATFVFVGTVNGLSEAEPPSKRIAVVRVDRQILWPALFGDWEGREVNLVEAEIGRLKEGDKAEFYASAHSYGGTITLTEIGHFEPPDDPFSPVDAERLRLESDIVERLRDASLVIAGTVVDVRTAEDGQPIRSEHAPLWWEADVSISGLLWGRFDGDRITINFPSSEDVMWRDSPKYRVGQEGIWILRRDQQEKGFPSLRRAGWSALGQNDFLLAGERDLVEELLSRIVER